MYDHTISKLAITKSDIRPVHMVTLIFLWALCGYILVNMLTLSPSREIIGIEQARIIALWLSLCTCS